MVLTLFCSLQDPSGPILVSRDLKYFFFEEMDVFNEKVRHIRVSRDYLGE